MNKLPEAWLRGPLPEIPALLQPVAHALVQSMEEVGKYMLDFPDGLHWEKPAGRASVGFHLNHLTGVLDRMLTYAKTAELSSAQFKFLENEATPHSGISSAELVQSFMQKVDEALDYFKTIDATTLTEFRSVGRKKLPSTLIGILFHAGEHSQRHVGQLLVTVSVLKVVGN